MSEPGWWGLLDGSAGLALGGAPLGNLYAAVTDDAAQQTLDRAWELGVRCFDTAPHYGQGLSEVRLGRALRRRPRASFLLSTKVGRLLTADAGASADRDGYVQGHRCRAHFDFSADGVLRSIDDSLRRLGLDRIDIAYIHDLDRRTLGERQPACFRDAMEGAYPALARLRGEGVVRAIGLGVNEWEVCRDTLAHADPDCFMLAGRYTLLDQSAAAELMPACERRGVRLVLAGVFNSGVLASGAVPGATFDYRPAPTELLARVQHIEQVCRRHGVPLRAAALQFPRRAACVAGVVVGARSPLEIEDNVRLARLPIAPGLWQALEDEGLLARRPAATAG